MSFTVTHRDPTNVLLNRIRQRGLHRVAVVIAFAVAGGAIFGTAALGAGQNAEPQPVATQIASLPVPTLFAQQAPATPARAVRVIKIWNTPEH
jgi:hypothetical protein